MGGVGAFDQFKRRISATWDGRLHDPSDYRARTRLLTCTVTGPFAECAFLLFLPMTASGEGLSSTFEGPPELPVVPSCIWHADIHRAKKHTDTRTRRIRMRASFDLEETSKRHVMSWTTVVYNLVTPCGAVVDISLYGHLAQKVDYTYCSGFPVREATDDTTSSEVEYGSLLARTRLPPQPYDMPV